MNKKIKVGITHGDYNGIGYEVLFKAFENEDIYSLFTPVVYGLVSAAKQHKKLLQSKVNIYHIDTPDEAQEGRLNFIDVYENQAVELNLGTATPQAGRLAHLALERAVEDAKAEKIDVLVTLPINKEGMQSETFAFPGHTEYLQSKCEGKAVMILMNELMRIVLLTTHIPLAGVAQQINKQDLEECLLQLHTILRRAFRITMPRIAVLGLNPHCGDNGVMGEEEQTIISPLVKELFQKGVHVFGPYSADGFFGAGHYRHFDAVLAMYHDQGLAPFKALAMESGVNFTAGLDIVRTSPDHGTAYDIVGKNKASALSLLQAIYTAIDVYRRRKDYDEITANPLQILPCERRVERYHSTERRANNERKEHSETQTTSKNETATDT